jgi:cellulose biosynthesis protein BcsQ
MRVTIANHKGGAGKTTAAVNLAAAVAELGRRVLVVDLDPQANASRRLNQPFDREAPAPTTSEVVQSGAPGVAADAIVPCGWPAPYAELVDIVPSRFDLDNRVSEAGTVGAVGRLRRALEGADDDYDVTLIDSPPTLGHLAQLGFAASDGVLVVVEPEYDSVEGALRVRDFIAGYRADLGRPDLDVIGYLVNRARPNVSEHAFQLDGLAERLNGPLWAPHIPEWTASKDGASAALPLRVCGSARGPAMADLWVALASQLLTAVAVGAAR